MCKKKKKKTEKLKRINIYKEFEPHYIKLSQTKSKKKRKELKIKLNFQISQLLISHASDQNIYTTIYIYIYINLIKEFRCIPSYNKHTVTPVHSLRNNFPFE